MLHAKLYEFLLSMIFILIHAFLITWKIKNAKNKKNIMKNVCMKISYVSYSNLIALISHIEIVASVNENHNSNSCAA